MQTSFLNRLPFGGAKTLLVLISLLCALVHSQESTDSIRDAGGSLVSVLVFSFQHLLALDELQSGYLPNHRLDPAVVGSASFGIYP